MKYQIKPYIYNEDPNLVLFFTELHQMSIEKIQDGINSCNYAIIDKQAVYNWGAEVFEICIKNNISILKYQNDFVTEISTKLLLQMLTNYKESFLHFTKQVSDDSLKLDFQSLQTNDSLENVFIIDYVENVENEMFSKGNWVFILFHQSSEFEITFLEDLSEIISYNPNLNFAFKPYSNTTKIIEFSNTIKEFNITPTILFKKGNTTKFLPSREYDITELEVLFRNFNTELKKVNIPSCYLCNTIEGLNEEGKCTLCSGSAKQVKPKCIIDSSKITPIKDIEKFVNASDEFFFKLENHDTLVFGKNMIPELLKMLSENIDEDLDYKIFIALRLCGVEIWGSLKENIKYRYRLPEENTFKEIVKLNPKFKLRIQNDATSTDNTFTLSINDFPKNMFFVNHIQYDSHSKFFEETWILILFDETISVDTKVLYEIIEIAKGYPNLNFGLKSFQNSKETQEFITQEIDIETYPIILYRKEFESSILSFGLNHNELKELLDNF